MRSHPPARFAVVAGVACLFCGAGMVEGQTGPNASFSDFSKLADVTDVQVRLAYVSGLQDEPLPALILHVSGRTAASDKFRAAERPNTNIAYPNQSVIPRTQKITTTQMAKVIEGAGAVPAVVSSSVASKPWVAFALYDASTNKVAEAVLNVSDSVQLVAALSEALRDNAEALASVTELACPAGALGPERPTDVTANVTVRFSGVRRKRKTDTFVGEVSLTNKSSEAIGGPISVAFTLGQANLRLHNRTGTTCATSPAGLNYINVPLDGNSLAPGARVEFVIEYDNADRKPIAPTVKVLAGPGAR